MIRFVCQTIYLLCFAALFFTGCLALASGKAGGGQVDDFADENLRALIWHLGGWLSPVGTDSAGRFLRSVALKGPDGADTLKLTMVFKEALDSWPMALEVSCRAPKVEGLSKNDLTDLITLSDARPFGRENLSGHNGRKELLADCLSAFASQLGQGPWLEPLYFVPIEPGLFLAETSARFGPRLGSKDIIIFKASPDYFRLSPYHESEKDQWRDSPATIRLWAQRLPKALLIINAGQYYPDRSYMGILRREGLNLSAKPHRSWMGYVVQDKIESLESFKQQSDEQSTENDSIASDWRLIDLDTMASGAGPEEYATVIQSYMVLDQFGRVRVQKTDRLASRSALAIDQDGDIWIVLAPGALSLGDLALLLSHMPVVSAMGLDGGLETQVALKGLEPKFWLGSHTNNILGNFMTKDFPPSLPAVIALERLP